MKESLDKDIIIKELGRSIFSSNFIFYQKIKSTNTLAKELALKGEPHGTIILAEEQTAGRGRLDRKWLSPGHENLLFTILLRPPLNADNIFPLTMILAISAIDAINDMTGLNVLIKWPNDLYFKKKKLGGILTEFSLKAGVAEYVVLGLGINVNWMPGEGDGLSYPATSLLAESGIRVSRNRLITGILKRFEVSYENVLSGKTDDLHLSWNKLSLVIGKDVEIISPDEVIRGRAIAIDHKGALILKNALGKEIKILSGDVSLRS
jgi:BirA family transcriptional regulator, biotin operon repressor / biotin---[acetyl-CoA-carboxylase] ligase